MKTVTLYVLNDDDVQTSTYADTDDDFTLVFDEPTVIVMRPRADAPRDGEKP